MAAPAPSRTGRDQFLDALRAIAIVRVALWHAFGEPILSWTIATMPVMFFIAGSLLINSFDQRPTREVLRARLKRLLVPFWMFGAIVLGFLSVFHLTAPSSTTGWSLDQLPAWGFPLVNPTASLWEAGWATSPLWYLRAYLWLLLLSPLLVIAWRRFGLATIGALLAVMLAGQYAGTSMAAGPTHWAWIVGDLGIYGAFLVLGFAHRDGAFSRVGRRALTEWVVLGVAATAVAWVFWPSADGVVNHSYPALFGWGVAWLAVALLARPVIDRIAAIPAVSAVVYWMTRRAMSIYLWHSPAIVGAYVLIDHLGARPAPTLLIPTVAALTVVAATATGWIEDVAAGRPADLWPSRGSSRVPLTPLITRVTRPSPRSVVPALVGAVTALVFVATVVPVTAGGATTASARADDAGPGAAGLALPPAPSGRPDPTAGTAQPEAVGEVAVVTSPTATGSWRRSRFTESSLTATVESWRRDAGVDGVAVIVSLPDGDRHAVALGTDEDGAPMAIDTVRPVTSVTKTMTAAIVLQLVDEGLLDLDSPLSEIPGAGPLPGGETITVRQLLDHSSGLAPYQETPGYDAGAGLDALSAVRASLSTPLQWAPGSQGGYSNSGFLALGLLIESATGRPYADVLAERVISPHGLTATGVDRTQTAGWVGGSAGGVVSTVDDLARWGEALYRDGTVVAANSTAAMTSIDETLVSGLGAFPVCPCTPNGDGTLAVTSVGHNGGSVTLQFSPGDGIVIAAAFSESFWTTSFDQAAVYRLLATIRGHVSA